VDLYIVDTLNEGFVVRRRPHPLDVPDQPRWLVDLAYEHCGGRREPATVLKKSCYLALETRPEYPRPFCDYYGVVKDVASTLIKGWIAPPETWHEDREPYEYLNEVWLTDWLITQTSRAIGKLVHTHWRELLAHVDPTMLAIHRKVFAANFGCNLAHSVLMKPELYRERFIVSDILSFRAAQLATGIVKSVEEMASWRSLFCPEGVEPYTSLNKTLTKVPGGVPVRLLLRFKQFVLPRPIFNRLELLATLCAVDENNFDVFANAKSQEIMEAMQRVARFTHWDSDPRRWRDVLLVVRFLQDFPEIHHGRLLGLTEKAIRWHRDAQGREIQRSILELGEGTPVATPPIPLPTLPGICFLSTVGAICDEAKKMENCIASYAKRAVNGCCYLFHVEWEGEMASVEVNQHGVVMQAQGPKNWPNKAAAWGNQVLSQWGRQLQRRLLDPSTTRHGPV
jgi:hypothetical protein